MCERRWVQGPRLGVGVVVSGDRGVLIALTDGQVAQVLREASGQADPASLLSEVSQIDVVASVVAPLLEDPSYSRSVLRALLVINALPLDGNDRGLTDVARELGLSASTTHRYMHTLIAVGLIEQNPRSRRYRRPPVEHASARGAAAGGADAG
jgi:DNA-binding MarR family transcriptional regulator